MDLHAAVEATFDQKYLPKSALLKSVLFASLAAFAMSSCGRSAPDGGIVAAPTSVVVDDSQPLDPAEAESTDTTTDVPSTEQMAGVRVVSDDQLVTATTTQPVAQTTSTTEAPVAAASTYTVQPGDTLSVIAERLGVPLSELSAANGIGDVDTIKPGQELIVPAVG